LSVQLQSPSSSPGPSSGGPHSGPAFSYPELFLRAFDRARRGALAKSISNWHLIGHSSNTGYCSLIMFYGIRLWIWPEPLVALGRTRVRRALGMRMSGPGSIPSSVPGPHG
jgi:hypothetical protein